MKSCGRSSNENYKGRCSAGRLCACFVFIECRLLGRNDIGGENIRFNGFPPCMSSSSPSVYHFYGRGDGRMNCGGGHCFLFLEWNMLLMMPLYLSVWVTAVCDLESFPCCS